MHERIVRQAFIVFLATRPGAPPCDRAALRVERAKRSRTRNGKSETSFSSNWAHDSQVGSLESGIFIGSLLTDVEDPQQTSALVHAILLGQNRVRRLLNFEGAGPDD
jgi:hypothetical protein